LKVSVVVATYKATEQLRRALALALSQTWADIEVIVSDDARDPAVQNLVMSFSDQRLRYRCNDDRLGPAGNHWAAFAEAKGELIGILNHDDVWKAGFVDELRPAFDDPEVILAFCDHDIIDADDSLLERQTELNSARWHRDTLAAGYHQPLAHLAARGVIPIAMGGLWRRSALPPLTDFDPGGAYDLFLSLKLAASGGAAVYAPERLTSWRVHPEQLKSNPDLAWLDGSRQCFRWAISDERYGYCRSDVAAGLASAEYVLARRHLSQREFQKAAIHAAAALRLRPWRWRAWCVMVLAALGRAVPNNRLKSV
jgi:GT2 family glycosyltransferase